MNFAPAGEAPLLWQLLGHALGGDRRFALQALIEVLLKSGAELTWKGEDITTFIENHPNPIVSTSGFPSITKSYWLEVVKQLREDKAKKQHN